MGYRVGSTKVSESSIKMWMRPQLPDLLSGIFAQLAVDP